MKRNSLVFESLDEMIGATPCVKLGRSLSHIPVGEWLRSKGLKGGELPKLSSELWAKLEFMNPGGSVKDRIAKSILKGAIARGELKPGGTVVEATSGNTGAGLAMLAAYYGYRAILVMPDKMSAEKINVLRAYGAKVVITPSSGGPEDPAYYCNVAQKIASETPGAFLANQYFNPDNPKAHYESTGPEIWEQMQGRIDVVVIGIGTGGTLSGTAKFLKEKNPKIQVVAVDPKGSIYSSVIESGKVSGHAPYLVEGIGEDMIPGTMDLKMVDACVTVNDAEAFAATRMLAQKEALLVGGSCGAAWYGAVQYLALKESLEKKNFRALVILPDSGSRYLSKVFNPKWLKEKQVETAYSNLRLGGDFEYFEGAQKVEGVE